MSLEGGERNDNGLFANEFTHWTSSALVTPAPTYSPFFPR
jgi:hypothetical protein